MTAPFVSLDTVEKTYPLRSDGRPGKRDWADGGAPMIPG